MGVASGRSGPAAVLLTREVRWFQQGAVPDRLVDWFTGSVTFDMEQRVDRYDLDAASRGIGFKQRNLGSVDSKHRLSVDEGVELAPGITGQVEDWLKIATTLVDPTQVLDGENVDVAKDIFTRRYRLDGAEGDPAGCEAELAAVSIGAVEAWSLCFETFGEPLHRALALVTGIARFLDETPLPDGLLLDAGMSFGYPAWIRSMSLQLV